MTKSDAPKVFLCNGSKCRSRKRDKLREALAPVANVKNVPCQKICRKPVVAVRCGKHVEWFRRIDNKKARKDLILLILTGKLKKRLEKLQVRGRRDKLRR